MDQSLREKFINDIEANWLKLGQCQQGSSAMYYLQGKIMGLLFAWQYHDPHDKDLLAYTLEVRSWIPTTTFH